MEPLTVSQHPRKSNLGKWIYPVNSRRAGGLSLGINLNGDQRCTFDCSYCQVERKLPSQLENPPVQLLLNEVRVFLTEYVKAGHWHEMQLKDIALAGDGEPTLFPELHRLMEGLVALKKELALDCRLVLFTNGSNLHRPDLQELWPRFFAAQGEVWAKLDFWDQESFQRINGKTLDHQSILDNLLHLGTQHPLTLQACFFKTRPDQGPNLEEVAQWAVQFDRLVASGLKVDRIQAYTVARAPRDPQVLPYSDQEMEEIGNDLCRLIGHRVELFFSH
ncbi:MAG: hypothetical protein A2600_08410 [Candidatus Lambdaproteobacteria bacterium RIFOXYD1_FULL_56_27]|uniref:Radical SAM core domain-containing protein n=1 Tax=Candidatus Lambdaproteobacteria bacterium RIFOXYD2_FULL_56_26 TaxID=1817773 RepID=A0A1F6H081_9PROT|nr:MAG: hypothetical protein A2426_06670 [Candidatus Lambdaproteobacteria bacterium RIFOXYC1_FULL_56_13]OGH03808.1 MAG: hypothetical protein A2557_13740 [Candidatus Lambdaproteobacteria bacterium RIFOXYD2_FULL_56_26]OGH08802.1 MAG: hypothetical protein A2600_08410 [Candidatus Lambdaproteobacteria bacterium RIFOXYD1_FULL_56_27]